MYNEHGGYSVTAHQSQLGRGIHFVFSRQDLAARNILLSKDEVCKVADFGLSREVIDDEYNVQKASCKNVWVFDCMLLFKSDLKIEI